MAVLYGRAGRLTAETGGRRPGRAENLSTLGLILSHKPDVDFCTVRAFGSVNAKALVGIFSQTLVNPVNVTFALTRRAVASPAA